MFWATFTVTIGYSQLWQKKHRSIQKQIQDLFYEEKMLIISSNRKLILFNPRFFYLEHVLLMSE